MPVVIVEMWEGRTHEQKKKLARGITDAFVTIGVPATAVHVILKDNPKSCWAQGGTLCSETETLPKT
jgi:4-oxalocrotonate tautomerase